ncbi:hypothetical protein [uncultured Rikenella sp.]|uniref:hypothetical protein n=1 Tax=uncultured Rikenella sp. TaxID=368003 RepID=UPI002617ED8F|nr:hypothetical protein [uncultured Rikenella sp.]
MITSYIGGLFLEAYNAREGTDYNAERFFTEVFHPLFFDHEKYMLWPTNSPFVQGEKPTSIAIRIEKLRKLHVGIAKAGTLADASVALGFPAKSVTGTTSGQVTDMVLPLEPEDYYLSWIGAALGVGVAGGWAILFDRPEILLAVFDGWKYYRELLNGVSRAEGNKALTWNGCWVRHRFSEDFDPDYPTDNFLPHEKVAGGVSVGFETEGWANILQEIARHFPQERLMGYIWKSGQTNETIGFIPFELPEIVRPIDLYVRLFGIESARKAKTLFGTAWGFERCCQQGSIGIRAMEPKGLREIMEGRKALKYKPDDEQNKITFQTYLTWILAMLNNEELRTVARELAVELHTYVLESKQGKTDRGNQIENLLKARHRTAFNDAILPVVGVLGEHSKLYEVYTLINGNMPSDNVPYFLGLLRVEYVVL